MIVVFGSINIDIAVRISGFPAPGETVIGSESLLSPGGKGANQAHAARLAGSDVVMAGAVGNDPFASPALERLKQSGVDLSRVATVSGATGCASIWLSPDGVSTIVVSPGANMSLKHDRVGDDILTPDSVLVLQQEVDLEENRQMVERAKNPWGKIILNAAPGFPVPLEMLETIDYLIVNEIEIRQIADHAGFADAPGDTLPEVLSTRFGTTVIGTYGPDGLVCSDGSQHSRIASIPITAIDTTAAGDTFVGVFASCIDRAIDVRQALEIANRAAAVCCTRPGAQQSQPNWEEYCQPLT